jgi:hypothetical protein
MVQEGTSFQNTQFIQTVDGVITIGTTSTTWTQFGGGATYTGSNGILLTGNNFTAVADPTPANIVVGAGGISVDHTKVPLIYTLATIGDGSTTSIVVTHNLGTRAHPVQLFSTATPWDVIECDIQHTTTNTDTLIFAVAPTASQFTYVAIG